MADVENNHIANFDGTNFSNWKFRIETRLEELDLLTFVNTHLSDLYTDEMTADEQEKLRKKDSRCKSQIIQRIADSHLEYAKDGVRTLELTQRNIWKKRSGKSTFY